MKSTARGYRLPNLWTRKVTAGQVAIYAVLVLVFLVTFYPFFYVLSLAVMPYEEFVRRPVHAWPSGFTLLYFREILGKAGLGQAFGISVLRTLIGVTLNVVATTLAGFALSRRQLKFGRILTAIFLVPMFFSGGIIPYYLTVRATGLLNSFWVLVLPGLVAPIWLFVTRTYYLSYPEEIIESATLDGAEPFRIYWNVIWPTSTPLLATLAVMYGTGHWNEYFWSRILVTPNLWPATAHLYNIMQTREILRGLGLGTQLTEQSFIAAVAAMLIIPMLIIYPFLQRYVVRGILVGAVKG
jgi:putative aldouronate transport system permease protein